MWSENLTNRLSFKRNKQEPNKQAIITSTLIHKETLLKNIPI